jgi:hypothetical protein
LPPRAQLPTCVHTLLRARPGMPNRLFAVACRPHAACQLPQLGHPRTHLRTSQILSCWVTSTTADQVTAPLAKHCQPSCHRPGARHLAASEPPLWQPPAGMDLPRPIRPEHPLSLVGTTCGLKIHTQQPHNNTVIPKGTPTSPAKRACALSALGPPHLPPREGKQTQPHPGYFPPLALLFREAVTSAHLGK